MKKTGFIIVLVGLFVLMLGGISQPDAVKPNILFIAIDDLRPELNCYGKSHIISPNIDKLAAEGCLFQNHFVSVPTCGASRYSLLTGMRPKKAGHLSNEAVAQNISRQAETAIPETFIHLLKKSNYYTVGIGKISHYPDGYVYPYDKTPQGAALELPHSWHEMLFDKGKWGTGHNAFFGYADGTNRNSLKGKSKPYEAADTTDEGYPDGLTAQLAIKKLGELKQRNQPFFLAIGFFKPHLPFNAPKKYWDMYDADKIALSPNPNRPQNTNKASLHDSGEFNSYQNGDEKPNVEQPVSDAYARKLRQGYYACISYVDAQIGKVMQALAAQGLADNTIIVLWGDHGWHLGDQRIWGKHTCFDASLRSPLIIKHPKMAKNVRFKEVVSTIDIYPTLMDFCKISLPHTLDGQILAPFRSKKTENKENVAYSYFNKGISMRNNRYRMTQYFREQQPTLELYDLKKDPYESKNIAADKPKIVKSLIPLLEKGNTGLYKK